MNHAEVLAVLTPLFNFALPVVTFLLGKAAKGANQSLLTDQNCRDILKLEATVSQLTTTTANHSTLHTGYEVAFREQREEQRTTNIRLGKICGKLGIE